MQSFDELMSMDDTQLRALAESMGMKKSHTDSVQSKDRQGSLLL